MFLTRECDYAIRVVRALADMDMKSVSEISDLEHIPRPFAYKILKKLEVAGFVSAYRGPYGGYKLASDPDNITLYDLVSSIDSQLFVNECLQPGYSCPLNTIGKRCAVHEELARIQDILIKELRAKKMSELV